MKTILLGIVVVSSGLAFFLGLRATLRTEYPFTYVGSGSMRPTLNVGDFLVVQGILNASEVKAAPKPDGDIIVFRSPGVEGELFVHRAVNKAKHNDLWYFETQGDASTSGADYWNGHDTWNGMISEKLLVGRVIYHVPWLGYIPLYIRTPIGMLLIIVLFLIIIFVEYVPIRSKKPTTIEVNALFVFLA